MLPTSPPAQKPLPVPVIIIARTSGAASTRGTSAARRASRGAERAFSRSGRLRRRRASPSVCSTTSSSSGWFIVGISGNRALGLELLDLIPVQAHFHQHRFGVLEGLRGAHRLHRLVV